jgi:N,N'-diacetyllegionaminate synthase
MSYLAEVERALLELTKGGTDLANITVLHCNTDYPTSFQDVNLRAMLTIRDTFGVKIGYSDHTVGTDIPIAAVALGATVIEKHFTLDRNLPGPDHKASMEPAEFKNMVESIRNVEAALGSSIKQPSASELPNIQIVRKSIVARKNIMKGETFSPDNITVKRPGNGLSPLLWDQLIGTKATKDYLIDELIKF